MKTGISLVTVIAGFIIISLGQVHQRSDSYEKWLSEALRLYELEEPTAETDSIALTLFLRTADHARRATSDKVAIDCYIKAGNIHQTYYRFEQSNELYHQSISLNNSRLKDPALLYEAFLYLGSSFYFSNIIDSAQHYFEAASAVVLDNAEIPLPEKERLYNSLGAIYYESANYLQAINYFERALDVTPESEDYDDAYVSIQSNIANCLMQLNSYDSALVIYAHLQKFDPQPEIVEVIRQNTAHTLFELGRYDEALEIYHQLNFSNPLNRIRALSDEGRIYMRREQWQLAEATFDSAIVLNRQFESELRNKDEALAYLYRGQLAARQGLSDEGINWCNQALAEIHLDFEWERYDDLPEDVSRSVSPITLFEILHTKASLLFEKYQADPREQYLVAALRSYRKALDCAMYIKLSFDNDEARLFFNRNYQPIYSEAIDVAFQCAIKYDQYLDDYIYILESYKGNVLHHNFRDTELKARSNVPQHVKQREADVKQLLALYTSRLNNSKSTEDAEPLQERLLELQVELSRIQKQYERDETYNLYKLQVEPDHSTLRSVRAELPKDVALLNYYVSEKSIYVLAISRKRYSLKSVAVDSAFRHNMDVYLREIYNQTEGKRYEGTLPSVVLYRKLIAPVQEVTSRCSKWVVIPDGALYHLPFEALQQNASSSSLVLAEASIGYHYSYSLLFRHGQNEEKRTKQSSVAFAPFSETDVKIEMGDLPHLPFSREEVLSIEPNIFLSNKATKQQFIEESTQHGLLHLATHASTGADSISNWIQFYPASDSLMDNRLFLHEIYNLNLDSTQLVILSACETAGGATTSGDGLLSLSRAFMYAGSQGIVSTLWKSEDRVTAYLMERFHYYLHNGYPPEEGLRLSKLDMLNDKRFSSRYKSPNYWANFVYVGKLQRNGRSVYRIIWIAAPLLTLVALGLYLRKRKKVFNK